MKSSHPLDLSIPNNLVNTVTSNPIDRELRNNQGELLSLITQSVLRIPLFHILILTGIFSDINNYLESYSLYTTLHGNKCNFEYKVYDGA